MQTPDHLRYSTNHEWVERRDDRVRIGITDYAQDALGDVVYAEPVAEGRQVGVGDPVGEVESTKSVSDVYAPVAGTVVAVNTDLADEPELINADPYGRGWWCELEPDADGDLSHLLDAAAYRASLEQ